MNISVTLCILRPYIFLGGKPTHPTKVWKIPHFFETIPNNLVSILFTEYPISVTELDFDL